MSCLRAYARIADEMDETDEINCSLINLNIQIRKWIIDLLDDWCCLL